MPRLQTRLCAETDEVVSDLHCGINTVAVVQPIRHPSADKVQCHVVVRISSDKRGAILMDEAVFLHATRRGQLTKHLHATTEGFLERFNDPSP